MENLFKHILMLSFTGSLGFLIYILLSHFINKHQTSIWNYRWNQWLLILFVVPFYLFSNILDFQILQNHSSILTHTTHHNYLSTLNQPLITQNILNQVNRIQYSPYTLLTSLTYLWMIGIVLYTVVYLHHFLKFQKLLKYSTKVKDVKLIQTLHKLQNQLKLKDGITLYTNPYIHSPFITGCIHKKMIIPATKFSLTEYYHIFHHECIHSQQKDLVWKFMLIVVQIIHWFNPSVILLTKTFNQMMEDACDEKVVLHMNPTQRKEYASTILHVMSQTSAHYPAYQIDFASSENNVQRRILKMLSLHSNRKSSKCFTLIISTILIIMISTTACLAKPYMSDNSNSSKYDTRNIHSIYNRFNATLPLKDYNITCGYNCYDSHQAIDMTSHYLDVVSFADGTISEIGYDSTLGNYITIYHDEHISTKYAQLAEIKVKLNDDVSSGDKIAVMGNSGNVTGTHLHFELLSDNVHLDPTSLFE